MLGDAFVQRYMGDAVSRPGQKHTETAKESRKTGISVRAENCINFRLVSHRYMTDKLPIRCKAPKPINLFKNMCIYLQNLRKNNFVR